MENADLNAQSIIFTFDIDAKLYDRLKKIDGSDFSIVEINTQDPNIITKIRHEFPNLRIGAGNIVDTNQLEICNKAGAHFITSPGFLSPIAQTANVYSINYIPGVMTPSEAMQALHAGCKTIRPFPASLALCKLLDKTMPFLRQFPAGVHKDELESYLSLPAVAGVCIANPSLQDLESFMTTA